MGGDQGGRVERGLTVHECERTRGELRAGCCGAASQEAAVAGCVQVCRAEHVLRVLYLVV